MESSLDGAKRRPRTFRAIEETSKMRWMRAKRAPAHQASETLVKQAESINQTIICMVNKFRF
jgi:hypothetical protein